MGYIISEIINSPHGFSLRTGGVSEGIFDSLNLGMHRGDDPYKVSENWRIFLEETGIINGNSGDNSQIGRICCARQVHGAKVLEVTRKDLVTVCGMAAANGDNRNPDDDIFNYDSLPEADGFVTAQEGVPLVVFTADCTPVILEDPKNRVIGCIHCGWRSTAADIMKEAVSKMCELGAETEEIRAAIGPAICFDCFEVGEEVVDAMRVLLSSDDATKTGDAEFATLFRKSEREAGKFYLDLRGVISLRFGQLGISKDHIEISELCTMETPDLFWSHRYTKGERGSQANVICLQSK